jgi:hypothetical protein
VRDRDGGGIGSNRHVISCVSEWTSSGVDRVDERSSEKFEGIEECMVKSEANVRPNSACAAERVVRVTGNASR